MFAVLFGILSLLYATVGQAGGTAFLGLMAFAAFPPSEMRPTALALNIVAAAYSTWVFNREKAVDWRKLRPLLFSSLPTALRRNNLTDGAKDSLGSRKAPSLSTVAKNVCV